MNWDKVLGIVLVILGFIALFSSLVIFKDITFKSITSTIVVGAIVGILLIGGQIFLYRSIFRK